ncbi:hypothetical protein AB3N02_13835 [Priestia aryabhattai]|uniref:hypothetical protein n=1 Tax=Priestia aryabhattai TaxID=412384 RepID=UPI00399FCDEF
MGRWSQSGKYVDYNVEIDDIQTTGMLPMQMQEQLTPQEKTLNAVTVNAGITTNFTANAINMDGYTQLGVGLTTTNSHSFSVVAINSPDGSTTLEAAFSKARTALTASVQGAIALNYAVIQIINNDAATQTYNVWTRKFN